MAVVNKDTIMERLRENFNDNDSDDVLGLLEDVTDTLNDYQSRLEENGDWKERYEQNDREWRQKYKDRFSIMTLSRTRNLNQTKIRNKQRLLPLRSCFILNKGGY